MYSMVEFPDGTRRNMTAEEKADTSKLPKGARIFRLGTLQSSGYTPSCMYDIELDGETYKCGKKSWVTNQSGMKRLIELKRVFAPEKTPQFVRYHDDFPYQALNNVWDDTAGATNIRKHSVRHVLQTS